MSSRARLFTAFITLQALFLLSWAGYHEWVRQHAPVVLLEAHPVDPQDLLRGDFMILSYPIGELSSGGSELKENTDVWVLLEPRERHHVVAAISAEKPAAKPDQLLVRGRIQTQWRQGGSTRRVIYGIERYYVPEGKGTPQFKTMEVEASVSPAHRLYIRRLLLDGKPYPKSE